jgi:hypothetical protein
MRNNAPASRPSHKAGHPARGRASPRRARSHAARSRAYRQRQAAGRACFTVELGPEALDLLVRYGWLDEREALDPAAVGRAIRRFIEAAAENP